MQISDWKFNVLHLKYICCATPESLRTESQAGRPICLAPNQLLPLVSVSSAAQEKSTFFPRPTTTPQHHHQLSSSHHHISSSLHAYRQTANMPKNKGKVSPIDPSCTRLSSFFIHGSHFHAPTACPAPTIIAQVLLPATKESSLTVGQGGKNRRRGTKENDDQRRELTFKEDGQEYAQVVKMLGNGRLEALCFDGSKRLANVSSPKFACLRRGATKAGCSCPSATHANISFVDSR